jgi:chemotaxis protein CheX
MNVKILNPFLEAVIEVMKAEVGITVTKGDLSLQKSALTTDDVTVLINLVGQIYGVVMYGMPISTGVQIVSRIMDQEFTELDSLAQSGIAELGNVITGRATVKFSEAGFQSNISPPMVIAGKGLQVSTLDFPRIIVPLKSEIGDMVVHLALREMALDKPINPEEFVSLVVNPSGDVG